MRTNILSALNELPDDEILKITDVIQDDLNMISTYELLPDLSTYSEEERNKLIIQYLENKVAYLLDFFDDFCIRERLFVPDDMDKDEISGHCEDLRSSIEGAWYLHGNWERDYRIYVK
jgi:hypothetical protein